MGRQILQLIESWSDFEEKYPGQDVEAFYRYMTQASHKSVEKEERVVQVGRMARVIGRLSSVYGLYHRASMVNSGLPAKDSFFFLNVLNQLGEVTKSELINYLLAETTTGMEAINKLVKAGLVRERKDPNDKRAKLVRISDKGLQKLKSCMLNAGRVNEMVFQDLNGDALSVCLQILEPVEKFHTKKSVAVRELPFDEMAADVLNNKSKGK